MRTKKVTVQESPVLSPDSVAIGKKKKGGSIEYKTLKLFANVAFQLTTSRRGRQQNCIFYSSLLHLLLAHCTNNLYPIIIIYIILTF